MFERELDWPLDEIDGGRPGLSRFHPIRANSADVQLRPR
jgi:hypothetical protein